jgi:hypothetical protein
MKKIKRIIFNKLKVLLKEKSPLDVKGINISINKEEIIDIIKEIRQR